MSDKIVKVNMFGDFTIEWNGNVISDNTNRSKKIWLLLAYMIYNRNRRVTQNELAELVWNSDGSDMDVRGTLKTAFFRVRAMLDGLGDDAGRTLILNDQGRYFWNPDVEVRADYEVFEDCVNKSVTAVDSFDRRGLLQQAIDEYKGLFLKNLQMEFWVMPISAYFANRYLESAISTVTMMEEEQQLDSAIALCRDAIKHEPANEVLSLHLMQNLLDSHDTKGVASEYNRITSELSEMYGIQPGDEIRAVFRKAEQSVNEAGVSFDVVYEQLQEANVERGALVCDYDFFKVLYHSAARSMARSGDVCHVVLFSLNAKAGGSLSKQSLERAMDNLQDQLRLTLRSGDSVARCSASQFIVMLQQANFENCNMVCGRVLKSFSRQYPHSPAAIDFLVKPVKPI